MTTSFGKLRQFISRKHFFVINLLKIEYLNGSEKYIIYDSPLNTFWCLPVGLRKWVVEP